MIKFWCPWNQAQFLNIHICIPYGLLTLHIFYIPWVEYMIGPRLTFILHFLAAAEVCASKYYNQWKDVKCHKMNSSIQSGRRLQRIQRKQFSNGNYFRRKHTLCVKRLSDLFNYIWRDVWKFLFTMLKTFYYFCRQLLLFNIVCPFFLYYSNNWMPRALRTTNYYCL